MNDAIIDVPRHFTHTIHGQAKNSSTSFDVINPATGLIFQQAPDATREQLDAAVAAARAAQPGWNDLGWRERGAFLKRYAGALRGQAEALAHMLTLEQGKPLAESRVEIARAVSNIEGYAEQFLVPVVIKENSDERVTEHYQAAGVAAIISPWNAPVNLFAIRMAPYLQTGSTIIAKPSPYTPFTTLMMGEIARSIFPAGVVNVLSARDPFGQWMTEHPDIDRVSFTGSVRTGKKVMASAAGTLKRVGLELGGNDPALVLNDADVKKVAPLIVAAALRNAGQICMAIKRVYVPDSLYEPMLAALGQLVGALKVGNGLTDGVQIGPLQNAMQFEIVKSLLDDTRSIPGVRIVTGGNVLNSAGYFVQPTVVGDVPDDARIVQEEQFGPIIPVLRYSQLDEAIERANSTPYGLGASVWSSNPERAAQVGQGLNAGSVWVNAHMLLDVDIPFGGWKESGMGRGNGVAGLLNCVESKIIRMQKKKA